MEILYAENLIVRDGIQILDLGEFEEDINSVISQIRAIGWYHRVLGSWILQLFTKLCLEKGQI